MSDDAGVVTDRILMLDGVRRPLGRKHDFVTRATADEMVRNAILGERVEYEKMVKWYLQQLPELVARMLGDALVANGLSMLPPNWPVRPDAVSEPSADGSHAE